MFVLSIRDSESSRLYRKSCPRAKLIVWKALIKNIGLPVVGLVRLHFHDAFVKGTYIYIFIYMHACFPPPFLCVDDHIISSMYVCALIIPYC